MTDSPSNIVKLRNDLKALHPNILSIRCCLHGFNLLAKDIPGFPEIAKVVKVNQKLVNYFTSSHIWRKTLKNLEYPAITNADVRDIIKSRHHFGDNNCLVEALKPVIDVIGELEKRTTTLADMLGSFIRLYHNAKTSHYAVEDPIYFVALFLHPSCKKMAMSRKRQVT